jgi:hypothetical protein
VGDGGNLVLRTEGKVWVLTFTAVMDARVCVWEETKEERLTIDANTGRPAPVRLKPSELEMKSSIWATDDALPEPCGSDAFGAPSKKNSTGT